jgi:antitoxin HicB
MRRQIAVDQTRTYSVVLQPEPEGGFTVRVPAFPEIVTYGETENEALAMAKEAIELSVEHRLAEHDDIPSPDIALLRNVTVPLPSAA